MRPKRITLWAMLGWKEHRNAVKNDIELDGVYLVEPILRHFLRHYATEFMFILDVQVFLNQL